MTKARVNADNASADIQGVTAGTGLSGGGTSGTVTVAVDTSVIQARVANVTDTEIGYLDGVTSAIQTQLNAKAEYPSQTGNSGKYLTTNGTAASWGTVASAPDVMAGKNAVLNSAFNVWQRNTSFAISGSGYTADRWISYRGSGNMTVSRQVTGDTTNLPNIQYCARVQRNSGNTATDNLQIGTAFETVNSIPFAGKTVTISFYARRGANFSATNNLLTVIALTGTGTDQNPLSGFTGASQSIVGGGNLTTTWQRFSVTGTLPSTMTQIYLQFYYDPTGTAGAADFYEITGVQLEVGSVATPYSPYSPTYQGELAACQRYYTRFGGTIYNAIGTGVYVAPTVCRIFIPMPVFMRTAPTLSNSTASDFGIFNGSGNDQASSLSVNSLDVNSAALDINVTSRTAGYGGILNTRTNSSAFIAFSSEL